MPSFDDRSGKMVRPLLDLKQVTPPIETGPGEEHRHFSAPLSAGSEQGPVTSPLTRQFIVVSSPKDTRQLTAAALPRVTRQLPPDAVAAPPPRVTRQLILEPAPEATRQPVAAPTPRVPDVSSLPKVTRQLSAPLARLTDQDTQRAPLVIKGEMKKLALAPAAFAPAEQQKRRRTINLIGMGFLLLIIGLTVLTATPLGQDFAGLEFGSSLFHNPNAGPSSLVAQATATAIYHQRNDGYDPLARGSQIIGDALHSLGWPVGQCTYWANLRYHDLTGYWVSWNGNADQWVAGAHMAGWNVSQSPHVPSIMVLMPGVQTAGGYGHVAVVEGINSNGTVHTSNMNWYSNGGGFARESTADFTPGPGTYFVWHS